MDLLAAESAGEIMLLFLYERGEDGSFSANKTLLLDHGSFLSIDAVDWDGDANGAADDDAAADAEGDVHAGMEKVRGEAGYGTVGARAGWFDFGVSAGDWMVHAG